MAKHKTRRQPIKRGGAKTKVVSRRPRTVKRNRTKFKGELLLAQAELAAFLLRYPYEEALKERYEDMTVFALQALLAEYDDHDAQDESENPDLLRLVLKIKTLAGKVAELRA